MARKKDPAYEKELRDRFGKALSHLLQIKSWETITIKDICQEVGVSVGLFYYYYQSKEHLLYAKFDKVDVYFLNNVDHEVENYGFYDALDLYCQTYIDWIKRKGYQCMTQIMKFYMTNGTGEDAWFSHRGLYICLRHIAERGIARGEIKKNLTADQIAINVTIIIRGNIMQWCSVKEHFMINKNVKQMVSSYYDSIAVISNDE